MSDPTRTEARELAALALEATGSYVLVERGTPTATGGKSPVAWVYGQRTRLVPIARDLYDITGTIVIMLGVLIQGSPDAVEDTMDRLVQEAMVALYEAGFIEIQSDAGSGVPQATIDGKVYRVERITARLEDSNDGD